MPPRNPFLGPSVPVNTGVGPSAPMPGRMQITSGKPFSPLPGMVNARVAQGRRGPVAPTIPPPVRVDPDLKCLVDYAVGNICRCMIDQLRWTPMTTRPPSHNDVPFAGQKFDRHVGTGAVGTVDPPVPLVAGGGFTTILDFQVPNLHRGVITYWGIDVTPINALPSIDVRILIDGQPLDIYGGEYGAFAALSAGIWAGPPFGIATPTRDICEHLTRQNLVLFQMRNVLAAPNDVTVAARMGGWIYPPTTDSADNSIYSTFVDNPQRY